MNQELANKWVIPFYMQINHFYADSEKLTSAYFAVSPDLNPQIVDTLFEEVNWRPRITGAWFTAINSWQEFGVRMKGFLLKSELCYEGGGFLLAFATFADDFAIQAIRDYLDKYLPTNDPYGHEQDALCALQWIDNALGSSHLEDYMPLWLKRIGDEKERVLDNERFTRNMQIIKSIKCQQGDVP